MLKEINLFEFRDKTSIFDPYDMKKQRLMIKMFPSKCTHTIVNFYQYLEVVNLGYEDGKSSDNTEIGYLRFILDVRKMCKKLFWI